MKPQLQRIIQRIDAMTLRERVITFTTTAAALLFMVNSLLIEPQFAKQTAMTQQIRQDQSRLAEMQTAIQQKIRAHSIDPDADNLLRLQNLKQQYGKAQGQLMDMQKGLISPDKMTGVLEDILKRNGKLRLVSLKTLPVASLNEVVQQEAMDAAKQTVNSGTQAPANGTSGSSSGDIYKHGVEITVQGNYLDMMSYMQALETMPWQLFWGKAKLNVDEHPRATLTLTLFTLSLDKKWLNL